MKNEIETLLSHLQEECGELVQVVSKIDRFGMNNEYKGETNKQRLIQEIGDVLALVMILNLRYPEVVSALDLEEAVAKKIAKLKKYIPSLKDFDFEKALEEADLGT